jgi:hypothetical protein
VADQDSYVQVATDGSGKKIDNAALTRSPADPARDSTAGDTVYRQRVAIGDDANPRLQAELTGEAGRAALPVDGKTLNDIHAELAQIRHLLELLIGP